MIISVGTLNPAKIAAVDNVFRKVYGNDILTSGVSVSSGVPAQPRDAETPRGAENRAIRAFDAAPCYFGVGVEAGLMSVSDWCTLTVQYCAIYDGDYLTIGCGSGFAFPPMVMSEVAKGREAGDVMNGITGIDQIGRKQGAVGYLTHGLLDRTALTEQAVLMALIPRMNTELYEIRSKKC